MNRFAMLSVESLESNHSDKSQSQTKKDIKYMCRAFLAEIWDIMLKIKVFVQNKIRKFMSSQQEQNEQQNEKEDDLTTASGKYTNRTKEGEEMKLRKKERKANRLNRTRNWNASKYSQADNSKKDKVPIEGGVRIIRGTGKNDTIEIVITMSEIDKTMTSAPIGFSSPTISIDNKEGGNIVESIMGNTSILITCNHIASSLPEYDWKPANPMLSITGEPEIIESIGHDNRIIAKGVSDETLLTSNDRGEQKMIMVRLISSVVAKGVNSLTRAAVVIECPYYEDIIYSGSYLVSNGKGYLLTSAVVDKERGMLVALCITTVRISNTITLGMASNKHPSDSESSDDTITPMNMRKVYTADRQVTVYNLSSAPRSYVLSYLQKNFEGPSSRVYAFGALGPNKKSLMSRKIIETTERASIVVIDEDDENGFTKMRTLTNNKPKGCTLITLPKIQLDEQEAGSTRVVEALDQHAPMQLSRDLGIPHVDKIISQLNESTLQYSRPDAKWASGTAGIKAYCKESKIGFVEIKCPCKKDDTWIIQGRYYSANCEIKDLINVPASDHLPAGDLNYKYRAGATSVVETHKGPIPFKDIYTEKKKENNNTSGPFRWLIGLVVWLYEKVVGLF